MFQVTPGLPDGLLVDEGRMIVRFSNFRRWPPAAAWLALIGLGMPLSGCAEMSDNVATAFADPAKYDLYDCKQLEAERKGLATRAAELEGLMAKADTGVAGPVVAELAYRNDYIAVRGQSRFANEAWQRNKCHDSPPVATPAATAMPPVTDKPKHRHRQSGTAIN
jgi:hypothetical protein